MSHCVPYPVQPAPSPKSGGSSGSYFQHPATAVLESPAARPFSSCQNGSHLPRPWSPTPTMAVVLMSPCVSLGRGVTCFLSGILSHSQRARIGFQGWWFLPGISPGRRNFLFLPSLGRGCVWDVRVSGIRRAVGGSWNTLRNEFPSSCSFCNRGFVLFGGCFGFRCKGLDSVGFRRRNTGL